MSIDTETGRLGGVEHGWEKGRRLSVDRAAGNVGVGPLAVDRERGERRAGCSGRPAGIRYGGGGVEVLRCVCGVCLYKV